MTTLSLALWSDLVPTNCIAASVQYESIGKYFPDYLADMPSVATAVSDDGKTIVGYVGNDSFVWNKSKGMKILNNPPGFERTVAYNISPDGNYVVGGAYIDFSLSKAFRLHLPTDQIEYSEFYGPGWAITNDGKVAGRAAGDAAIWDASGGLKELGHLPEIRIGEERFANSFGFDISHDGSIIVGGADYYLSRSPAYIQAYRWTEQTGMVGLGFLPGFYESAAKAISGDGSVIIGESGNLEFIWSNENGMREFIPGGRSANLQGLSYDGSMIVGFAAGFDELSSGYAEAFIWNQEEGRRSLQGILVDHGIDLGRQELNFADDISADGSVIVGYGKNELGVIQPYIVTFIVPEPLTP